MKKTVDAFAAGLPIIGSNYAGIAERVKDGVNGLLFEWRNSRDLQMKLYTIVNDTTLLDKLKINVTTCRSFASMSKDFTSLYRKISS